MSDIECPNWLMRFFIRITRNEEGTHYVSPFLSQLRFVDNRASIRELGIVYRPLIQSVNDAVDSMIKFNLIKTRIEPLNAVLKISVFFALVFLIVTVLYHYI